MSLTSLQPTVSYVETPCLGQAAEEQGALSSLRSSSPPHLRHCGKAGVREKASAVMEEQQAGGS